MPYYIRALRDQPPEVWKIDDDEAVRLGITNARGGAGTYFKKGEGETIWDAIRRNATGWFEPAGTNPFHQSAFRPGQFHPRMARPTSEAPTDPLICNPGAASDSHFIALARGQLKALTRQLDRICQTVQPAEETLSVYGHEIRNLLILACTEAEMHWRGILHANGIDQARYDTRSYVKLHGAMRLGDYTVRLPAFPWLLPVCPFDGWGGTDRPTQHLPWYDAYNATKHNREGEFAKATLAHAFQAISACVVMMAAEFGTAAGLDDDAELHSFFQVESVPAWSLSDVYLNPDGCHAQDWTPIKFPFDAATPHQKR
jgi:hypothetical protein